MSNVTSVLAQAKALSEQEQQELLTQLEEMCIRDSNIPMFKTLRFLLCFY